MGRLSTKSSSQYRDGAAPELHAASTPRGRPTPRRREAGTGRRDRAAPSPHAAQSSGGSAGTGPGDGVTGQQSPDTGRKKPPGLSGGNSIAPPVTEGSPHPLGEEELLAWPVLQLQSAYL